MDYKVLPLATPPNPQALNSKTFKLPPLDGSLTIPEIYDWHLDNTPDHPLFVYSDPEGVEHKILWPAAVRAFHRAAHIVYSRVGNIVIEDALNPPVVAILSSADTITYIAFVAGIVRAGFTVFAISPRNSPAAVAHLLRKTKTAHVLVGSEQALQSLAKASFKLLDDAGDAKPGASDMPNFKDVFLPIDETDFKPFPHVKPDLDSNAFILHSSGSTAFPKPISHTHYTALQAGLTPHFGERDLCGRRIACHSLPIFHGMGATLVLFSALSGLVLATFQPSSPAILPNSDNVMKGSMDTKSDIIFCVPSFLEDWERNSEYVANLQKINGVIFGGGPLSKKAGDSLTRQGVSLFVLFGSTECGVMSPIIPKEVGMEWNYFQISRIVNPKFIPHGDGIFELAILPHKHGMPNVFNTTINGLDAYATNDLLEPHPTKPGYWRVFGRADDQIMHSTGEKTNPGPLESILNQDPHVHASLMFGRGRFNAGVLVEPKAEFKFDTTDTEALKEFRQKIWPTVERMNEYAPQHSRIFKEMILVSSPEKPFTYTAKNTPRRQATINNYEKEIDAVYKAVEETAQPDIPFPPSWDLPHALDFVRAVVKKVMNHAVKDEVDFFQYGCDSLQATWIRNTLLNALRVSTGSDTRSFPINFVYHHPSIASLATYISGLTDSSHGTSDRDQLQNKVDEMHDLVSKYSDDFPIHVLDAHVSPPKKDVVLVTGTTGGLGANILASLLQSPGVGRVYALNRKGRNLLERQKAALEERGLDIGLLELTKFVLLEGSLDDETLGLDVDIFTQVRTSVTHIIHNAYPVNFNMSLTSFEPSIAGLRRLIDLALSSPLQSPPRILFTSSIGVLMQHPSNDPVKEEPVEAAVAVGTGYSESKWVCEQLLSIAASKTPLKPVTVRIGQLSGTTNNGCWNSSQWLPAVFKSGSSLGCLPSLANGLVDPIDTAAQAIVEMRGSPAQVLHLTHPNPVAWDTIFEPASKELGVALVPYPDWLARLEKSYANLSAEEAVETSRNNPALRIVDFFRSANLAASGTEEAMGLKRLSLDEAQRVSQTMRDTRKSPLTAEDVRKWVKYWKKIGFL
ncbi:hypothetical protein DFH11DRAFT_1687657 [Phellopilus nigrolimitatus]|nr:hypothetical protein DFH11DRAFT_1687657 [Phellopilus nigrolimitatus]